MKLVVVLLLVSVAVALGSNSLATTNLVEKIASVNRQKSPITGKFKQEVLKALKEQKFTELQDQYSADVTDYANNVLEHVGTFLIENGIDPLELPDEKIDLLITGDIKLHDGWFSEMSTIGTYNKVFVKYNPDTKIIDLTLPISFDSLLITYEYKTTVLFISISGTIKAKISNVKADLHLGFDFNTYHAFVDNINIKDSGHIDFDFTGLGLLDWIIDAMSEVLTTLFHNLILGIINAVLYGPVESVVNDINKSIDDLLNRTTISY